MTRANFHCSLWAIFQRYFSTHAFTHGYKINCVSHVFIYIILLSQVIRVCMWKKMYIIIISAYASRRFSATTLKHRFRPIDRYTRGGLWCFVAAKSEVPIGFERYYAYEFQYISRAKTHSNAHTPTHTQTRINTILYYIGTWK